MTTRTKVLLFCIVTCCAIAGLLLINSPIEKVANTRSVKAAEPDWVQPTEANPLSVSWEPPIEPLVYKFFFEVDYRAIVKVSAIEKLDAELLSVTIDIIELIQGREPLPASAICHIEVPRYDPDEIVMVSGPPGDSMNVWLGVNSIAERDLFLISGNGEDLKTAFEAPNTISVITNDERRKELTKDLGELYELAGLTEDNQLRWLEEAPPSVDGLGPYLMDYLGRLYESARISGKNPKIEKFVSNKKSNLEGRGKLAFYVISTIKGYEANQDGVNALLYLVLDSDGGRVAEYDRKVVEILKANKEIGEKALSVPELRKLAEGLIVENPGAEEHRMEKLLLPGAEVRSKESIAELVAKNRRILKTRSKRYTNELVVLLELLLK